MKQTEKSLVYIVWNIIKTFNNKPEKHNDKSCDKLLLATSENARKPHLLLGFEILI